MIGAGRLREKTTKRNADSAGHTVKRQPLLKNSSSYQDLFLQLNDGFAYCQAILDKKGSPIDCIFIDANRAYRRLMDLNGKTILGKKASEVFSTYRHELLECMLAGAAAAQREKSVIFEKNCPTLGKWLVVNAYCPSKGSFAVVLRDITQRKATERALRQSEKRYKKLANSITDVFFALDSSLRFTYWNIATQRYTGISVEDAVGKRFFEVFDRNKQTSKAVTVYLDVMRTKMPRTLTDNLPKVDRNLTFEIQVYPTGNGISVLAKDISERKKLQASLEQYTQRLEELVRIRTEKLKDVERLATIGETAGMVGHDIRNPLQSIIGELYLAKGDLDGLPDGEAKRSLIESISVIEEQTLYINKIVSDLQDYAKASTPAIQECDLEEIIQHIIAQSEVPRNVEVSYMIETPFPFLTTDATFMKRILSNLTRNGIQAMQDKGGKLVIKAFPRQDSVIISVSDTGNGIPQEVREKMFKPLFTTKSKGQGFGLAVVKKLVEALGGMVSFETQLGRGTTFVVELPLNRTV